MGLLFLLILFGLSRCLPERSVLPAEDHGRPVANTAAANPLDQRLKSNAAVVMDMKSRQVIYAKNADTKRYPASLTKMMTLHIALQHFNNLEQNVTMPEEAFQGLEDGAATSGLSAGETITVREVMYGLILPSGADCAKALAILSAGSEDAFVQEMNDEARRLGMKNTHFANPTGLHDPKQVSSANDLAIFMARALKNKDFYEILSTASYTVAKSETHPAGLEWHDFLDKYDPQIRELVGNGIYQFRGGKTGYTPEAGICLASFAEGERGDVKIAVTLRAPGHSGNYMPALRDAIALYDQAYKED